MNTLAPESPSQDESTGRSGEPRAAGGDRPSVTAAVPQRALMVAWLALFLGVFATVLGVAVAYGLSSGSYNGAEPVAARLDRLQEEVIALRKAVEQAASTGRQPTELPPKAMEQMRSEIAGSVARAAEQLRGEIVKGLAELRTQLQEARTPQPAAGGSEPKPRRSR